MVYNGSQFFDKFAPKFDQTGNGRTRLPGCT
jgi:hypothetical protein